MKYWETNKTDKDSLVPSISLRSEDPASSFLFLLLLQKRLKEGRVYFDFTVQEYTVRHVGKSWWQGQEAVGQIVSAVTCVWSPCQESRNRRIPRSRPAWATQRDPVSKWIKKETVTVKNNVPVTLALGVSLKQGPKWTPYSWGFPLHQAHYSVLDYQRRLAQRKCLRSFTQEADLPLNCQNPSKPQRPRKQKPFSSSHESKIWSKKKKIFFEAKQLKTSSTNLLAWSSQPRGSKGNRCYGTLLILPQYSPGWLWERVRATKNGPISNKWEQTGPG